MLIRVQRISAERSTRSVGSCGPSAPAIEHHLPTYQLEMLKIAEASERDLIVSLVGKLTRKERDDDG